jgi:hypothetical protein
MKYTVPNITGWIIFKKYFQFVAKETRSKSATQILGTQKFWMENAGHPASR